MKPGSLIAERYRIVRQLAEGGQAAVYLANQEPLDRPVALKILTPGMDASDQERMLFHNRFLREARALANFDHPNIVVIFDYGHIGDGAFYIAMEYVEGVRFNELLRAGPMAPQRAAGLVTQVCDALRYAHEHKVIHRDIKHSNVLVRQRDGAEQVKVVDFGIAKMMEDETGLTLTGVVLGSAHFMAPEQARGSGLTPLVDVYAVGVLLYCSLTGRYPFDGDSFHKIIFSHLGQEIPPFSEINPAVSIDPYLEAIVRRCLAKEPKQRFADVAALIEALEPYLTEGYATLAPDDATAEHLPPGAVAMTVTTAATVAAGRGGLPWWLLPLGIGLAAFVLTSVLLVIIAAIVIFVMTG
ncbi:MAG: serine/threonine protein kinase [Myxococcota bacterium]|jgi:serine/threonine protein kinase